MAQLTNVQRAYLKGFRCGYQLARCEMRREAEDIINQLKDELRTEMCALRSEFARLQAIKSAANAERDESTWLN